MSILKLFRPKVSILVGLSAFAGTCLFNSQLSITHIYAVASAVLLSAGCSALNQVQEQHSDRMMERTADRPIPSGRISPTAALRAAALLTALSAMFIIMSHRMEALLFIPFTIITYNLLYTPLKKVTPFALMIGSVTGAIPPMMGYTILGGGVFSSDIMLVAVVMYLWQTPHFTLLAERYKDDYRKAGFKTISAAYGDTKANRFTKVWTSALVCALFLIPLRDIYISGTAELIHMSMTILFTGFLIFFRRHSWATFHILNLCMTFFFLLLVVDRIIL